MTTLSDWDIVSDAELVCAAAAGDRAAFAGIYGRYADRLHDFCIGMVCDRDTAADCVQDVFCKAATQLPKLREPEKLRPWLYSIARHEALRRIDARRREQVAEEPPEAASADPGPDTLAARSELAELIAAAAGGLPDRDRALLELAYRHGLDGPELGDALGVSRATANRMTSRLRETMERSLGALLVARHTQRSADGCPELRLMLAGWDGEFTILMRKRVARHIESCPACDDERRRRVSPAALLGAAPVFIPAPGWLRERTLDRIQLTSSSSLLTTDATANAGAADTHDDEATRKRRTRWLLLLALLAALIAATVLALAWQYNTTVAPAIVTTPAPPPLPTSTQPVATVASTLAPPPPPPTVDTPAHSIAPIAPPPPTWSPIPAAPITTPSAPPPSTHVSSTPVTTIEATTAPARSVPAIAPTTTTRHKTQHPDTGSTHLGGVGTVGHP
jgi:RNA polymerase sigma factor (sigma-70 family)